MAKSLGLISVNDGYSLRWLTVVLLDVPTPAARKKVFLATALALFVAMPWIVNADAVAEIEAQENAFNTGQLKEDHAKLDRLLADDYVSIYSDASVFTKKEFLSWFEKSAPPEKRAKPEVLTTRNESVHVYGDTAVVVGTLHEKGIFMGKPYEARGRFTDVWRLENGEWWLVLTHESHFPKGPKT
jgi:ketosteroid isomerase-like protein